MDSFGYLGQIIIFIQGMYDRFHNEIENVPRINLKKTLVKDIEKNLEMQQKISEYRDFLNSNMLFFITVTEQLKSSDIRISCRVKNLNSTNTKISNYMNNHENGEIPINKCLNDLFGVRIIVKSHHSYEEIKAYIESNFDSMKCVDSTKNEYIATHIYFKSCNYLFPWELQIWAEENESSNIISHQKYKQAYTSWEKATREECEIL